MVIGHGLSGVVGIMWRAVDHSMGSGLWGRGMGEPVPPVCAAWAKAGKEEIPHPLVCHAIDTAMVAERLYPILLGPRVREELEHGLAPLGEVRSWVAVLCGLHDLGKYAPIFQAMRDDLAVRSFGEAFRGQLQRLKASASDQNVKTPHGELSAAFLDEALSEWGANKHVRQELAHGLGGHHGSLLDAKRVQEIAEKPGHRGGPRWQRGREALLHAVLQLWQLGDPKHAGWERVSLSMSAGAGLAGLASVSDWVASDPNNFGYAGFSVDDLDAYRTESANLAQRALDDQLRWQPWTPPADTSFSALFPDVSQPRDLQKTVEQVISDRQEPGVLVIEAPTGEGKTKAAAQAAATLARQLGLAGMYVALPTRATAGQVYTELATYAEQLGLPGLPNLVHSNTAGHRGRPTVTPSAVNEDEDGAEEHEARDWFTRKRGLLFPVGVGTIDQALQAAIRSRHVFVRLAGLSNKVLVVDEVHELDTYMFVLLEGLMWWCGRLGLPVVLLSATLSAIRREELIARWRAGHRNVAPAEVPAQAPTPADGWQITWADDHSSPTPSSYEVSKVNTTQDVRLDRVAEKDLLAWLGERIASTGSALVIHSLVASANTTHEMLHAATAHWHDPPEIVLLTGRTSEPERARTEQWLRQHFGPGATHRPHAIVIGTQLLQHSLDLDFDVLVSDLCPIDILIQRAGRIHRHQRGSRATGPTIGIIEPRENSGGLVFPRGLHTVYPYELLWRTWLEIRDRPVLNLPGETAKLVHNVYVDQTHLVEEQHQSKWQRALATRSNRDAQDTFDAQITQVPPLRPHDTIRRLTDLPKYAGNTRKDRIRKDEPR